MATELLKKRCQASCRSQCSWQPPFCVFLGKNVSCLLPACELMRGKVSSVAPGFLPELSRLGFWQWKGQRLAPFTGGGAFLQGHSSSAWQEICLLPLPPLMLQLKSLKNCLGSPGTYMGTQAHTTVGWGSSRGGSVRCRHHHSPALPFIWRWFTPSFPQ